MGPLSYRQDDWQGTVYKLKGCPAIASITGDPIGKAHVAYLPDRRVDIHARRLQIQERMTVQIADTLNDVLQPKGVAVVIEASHQSMHEHARPTQSGCGMVTSRMLGAFRSDRSTRREFLVMIGRTGARPLSNT